jgi:hypothetical protein
MKHIINPMALTLKLYSQKFPNPIIQNSQKHPKAHANKITQFTTNNLINFS